MCQLHAISRKKNPSKQVPQRLEIGRLVVPPESLQQWFAGVSLILSLSNQKPCDAAKLIDIAIQLR